MSATIYINGQLLPEAEAKISVFDHGLLYGDGVFEGIRVYNGTVFLLQEHIERLYESAAAIRLEIPLSPEEMTTAVNETVAANNLEGGYVRLVITRGAGALGLDISRTSNPQVIIIAASISLYADEIYENGLKLITAKTIRNHPQALSPSIKSLNYLNNILAKTEGADAGTVEALMLNHEGNVAECTGDNIFIIKDGILKTPSEDAGALKGITQGAVMQIARNANISVEEVTMTIDDIYAADECFLTGTAAEVVPVISLDDKQIGNGKPGEMTLKLLKLFREFIAEQSAGQAG